MKEYKDLYDIGRAMLTTLNRIYPNLVERVTPTPVEFGEIFGPNNNDPEGVKTKALSELMISVIERTNNRAAGRNKFGVELDYSYIDKGAQKLRDDVITFYLPSGNQEAFADWLQSAQALLSHDQEQVRYGWHKEKNSGMEWYVHALKTDGTHDALGSLITLMNERGLAAGDDSRFRCRQFSRLHTDSDCRVRADAMDQFLAPAGFTVKDLHLEKQRGSLRQL